MQQVSVIEGLFAAKPKPFGKRGAPSSIVKKPESLLNITFDGAEEDEQGNKKLHGGPYMAIHQYSQSSYEKLQKTFPDIAGKFYFGSIGENISAPNMDEENVFIGDQYKIGKAILQVVSPRAPCSKINDRYGLKKIDHYIAEQKITGWYFSVIEEGRIHLGDKVELINRVNNPISVQQIWYLRQLKAPFENIDLNLALANQAFDEPALSPEWQAYIHRVINKLTAAKA